MLGKRLTQAQLFDLYKQHYNWLQDRTKGKRLEIKYTDLSGLDLFGYDLEQADLSYSNLSNCDLRRVNFTDANLTACNFHRARLSEAVFNRTHLRDTEYYFPVCPEKGSFIGWKKADRCIVELLIPEYALRSSATSRKCRCSEAKVLSITTLGGKKHNKPVHSDYDRYFIYQVGETIRPTTPFDKNRWKECSSGIHFYLTREEAVYHDL